MKSIIFALITLSSLNLFAIDITSCSDAGVSLNSVYSMKTYANSTIKVFGIDMVEPGAAPVGVAVAIDRGEELSTMESFCRYISGLYTVDVIGAKSKYDKSTNTITLTLKASELDENGYEKSKVLTISLNKGASAEVDLVKAELK